MAGITHQWILDGQDFGPPTNWLDFEIQGTFAQENEDELIPENQPNLSIDRLEWSGVAARYIANKFRSGLNGGTGAFQGVKVSWTISDNTGAYKAFDGYIDFTDGYTESDFKGPKRTEPNQVITKIVDEFGLNALLFAVNGITMDLIESEFTESDWVDINWVYVKKYDFTELVLLALSLYVLARELEAAVVRIFDAIADTAGGISGFLVTALKIAIALGYFFFILTQIISIYSQIINILWPKKRVHKGVTLRTLLTKAFNFAGYQLVSTIEELDNYTILPTLPTQKSNFADQIFNRIRVTEKGLPSINDFGFIFTEVLTLCRRLFNARLGVINNGGTKEVHLETDGSNFWVKQSNLTLLNNVLVDKVTYNTDELALNRYFRFATDTTDDWTKDELLGTSYEVITRSSPTFKEGGLPLEKGLDETFIPYALGVRNGSLSVLQQTVLNIAQIAENTVNFLGGNANFTSGLKNRENFLKVSNPEIAIPKLLYIENGVIPIDHREKLGAKVLVEKYGRTKSFIDYSDQEPFNNQYQIFEGVEIQFDLQKFLTLRNNSYFITDEGESGRIDDFKWRVSADKGTFTGRFRSVYDKSLTEETFELKNDDE